MISGISGIISKFTPSSTKQKAVALGAGIGLAALAGYGMYRGYKKAESKIIDSTAEHIIAALSLDNSALSKEEQEQKVRAIRIRQAVVDKLNPVGSSRPLLIAVSQYLSVFGVFATIDRLRDKLPQEATPPSFLEKLLIDQIASKVVHALQNPDRQNTLKLLDTTIAKAEEGYQSAPDCRIQQKYQVITLELQLARKWVETRQFPTLQELGNLALKLNTLYNTWKAS